MIPISNVLQNIEGAYTVFRKFILDKNFTEQANEIGWPSYRSGISKQVYAKQYEDLITARQFSFLLIDGSAVQIYYSYDDKGLRKIRLAYYPVPQTIIVEREQMDSYYDETFNDVLEAHYVLLHDLMGQGVSVSNTTHIRFDYDREVSSHSVNHFQIDGVQELRIPFKHIITPFHFMDFLIRSLYPAEYEALTNTPEMRYWDSASNKIMAVVGLEGNYSSIYMSI